jgi:hypothetical protein
LRALQVDAQPIHLDAGVPRSGSAVLHLRVTTTDQGGTTWRTLLAYLILRAVVLAGCIVVPFGVPVGRGYRHGSGHGGGHGSGHQGPTQGASRADTTAGKTDARAPSGFRWNPRGARVISPQNV